MTVVIVVVAIALGGAVIARVMWRQGSGERHSVREYQHTLETLAHISGREDDARAGGANTVPRAPDPGPAGAARAGDPAPAKVRTRQEVRQVVPDGPGETPAAGTGRSRRRSAPGTPPDTGRRAVAALASEATARRRQPRPDLPGPAPGRRAGPDTPAGPAERGTGETPRPVLVFEDTVAGPVLPDTASSLRPVDRRPWSFIAVVVVATALVAAAVALAVVELGGSSPSPPHTASGAATHPHTTVTTPPATTAPVIQPATQTPGTATYQAPGPTYTVVVTAATGECWVQARNPATGVVQWEGLLQQGSSQALPGSGPMEVELGAATASAMTLNGVPVALPVGFHSPFYATFSPT
jgi:hypothetical protein